MAEKIARTKIARDNTRMYFTKGNAVYSVPRGRKGSAHRKEATFNHDRDNDYIYFVDKDGDVARARKKQSRGRRKKKAGKRQTSASEPRATKRRTKRKRAVAASTTSSGYARRGPIRKAGTSAKKQNPQKNAIKKAMRELDSMSKRLR